MLQCQLPRFGDETLFEVVKAPVPEPGPGQVLVKVAAAGVNPVDGKIRDGSNRVAQQLPPEAFPLVLGSECSGTVERCGPSVGAWNAGDRVFGLTDFPRTMGGYAQYAVLPVAGLAAAADVVDLAPLGGVPLAASTAWQAVHDLGRVTGADTVLVHGGGGGVGQWIVQFAVATGARVFATASGRHHDRLRALGAVPIDYTTTDFRAVVPRADVVIDGVWFNTTERSLDLLGPDRRLVVLPTLADFDGLAARGYPAACPQARPDGPLMERVAGLLADGRASVQVAGIYGLAQVGDAHRAMTAGHIGGKLLIDPFA